MASKLIEALQERTNAKLRYARVHLDELLAHEPLGGDDYDRAHQESFLFHLLGAREAFLAELNVYYDAGVNAESLTPGALRKALGDRGVSSLELAELHRLDSDPQSWYSKAKAMRDHSTHQTGVQRKFHVGGEHHQKVFLTDPKTGVQGRQHFPLDFGHWLREMEVLITRLRASAMTHLAV